MSREELAAATKVSLRQIEALETGRFDLLPAPVFTRGFVKAMSAHLRLDVEATVAEFTRIHGAWQDATESQRRSSDVLSSASHPRLSRPRRAVSSDTTVRGLAVAALLAVVTGGAVLVKSHASDRAPKAPVPAHEERAETGPASLALPPAIAEAAVALPPETAAPGPASPPVTSVEAAPMPVSSSAAERGGLNLTLNFRDDCWTEVRAGGKLIAAELFHKGTTRQFSGSKFTLTLGNAGGVVVTVDGHSLRPIGGAGQVVRNFVIDEANAVPRTAADRLDRPSS